MKRKAPYILRQALVAIIALQFLNLSLDSQAYQDDDQNYDYSYSYNTPNDPTESAIEWIIEMNAGQKAAFSYDGHSDTNKNLSKTFHWQTDLHIHEIAGVNQLTMKRMRQEHPAPYFPSPTAEIFSPPPEARA